MRASQCTQLVYVWLTACTLKAVLPIPVVCVLAEPLMAASARGRGVGVILPHGVRGIAAHADLLSRIALSPIGLVRSRPIRHRTIARLRRPSVQPMFLSKTESSYSIYCYFLSAVTCEVLYVPATAEGLVCVQM